MRKISESARNRPKQSKFVKIDKKIASYIILKTKLLRILLIFFQKNLAQRFAQ